MRRSTSVTARRDLGNLAGGTATVTHTYAGTSDQNPRVYTATVQATDINGETSAAQTNVVINPRAALRVTITDSAGTATASGQRWTFTATVAGVEDAAIESFEWDFGDGGSATTSGNAVSHVYDTSSYGKSPHRDGRGANDRWTDGRRRYGNPRREVPVMSSRPFQQRGYAMAALLVGLSVMSVMLSMALPVWRTWVQRERETELIFRGEQYVQAINLFSRRTGGFPTSLDQLRQGRYIRRLYTDPITDGEFQPVYLGQVAAGAPTAPGQRGAGPGPRGGAGPGTGIGGIGQQAGTGRAATPPGGRAGQPGASPFTQPGRLGGGAGPIIGVVSRSTAESIREYNGRGRYNEWVFVASEATRQAGPPGGARGRGPQTPVGPRGRIGQAPRGGQGGGFQLPGGGMPAAARPLVGRAFHRPHAVSSRARPSRRRETPAAQS